MTLSGMTPAEGWRLLEPGETIQEGDRVYIAHELDWKPVNPDTVGAVLIVHQWPRCRRLDPDPLTPLREELREGVDIVTSLLSAMDYMGFEEILEPLDGPKIKAWLERNAAFGPGKGDQ